MQPSNVVKTINGTAARELVLENEELNPTLTVNNDQKYRNSYINN